MTINLSKNPPEHFCVAPWVNIHINPEGNIKPCCYGSGTDFGEIQNLDWSYITGDNKTLNQLKSDMMSDTQPAYCHGCTEAQWYEEFLNPDLILSHEHEFQLKSIDVRWGITCQLSCTYCDQWNSSTWAQLEQRSGNKIIPIQGRTYKNQYDPLLEFIKTHRDHIHRVNMLGGEPLLLPENSQLLDIIRPDTRVELFTNLNLDLERNPIFQKLADRDNVTWRISMENVEHRFEFVRRGASWDQQVKNLKLLSEITRSQNSDMNLQSQYCVYSALRSQELYDFVSGIAGLSVEWSLALSRPTELDFFQYPRSLKEQSLVAFEKYKSDFVQGREIYSVPATISDVIEKLHQNLDHETAGIIHQCHEFHQNQAKHYFNNQNNFAELWPEFAT